MSPAGVVVATCSCTRTGKRQENCPRRQATQEDHKQTKQHPPELKENHKLTEELGVTSIKRQNKMNLNGP
eukprot:2888541-Amphidinium_carterae.1